MLYTIPWTDCWQTCMLKFSEEVLNLNAPMAALNRDALICRSWEAVSNNLSRRRIIEQHTCFICWRNPNFFKKANPHPQKHNWDQNTGFIHIFSPLFNLECRRSIPTFVAFTFSTTLRWLSRQKKLCWLPHPVKDEQTTLNPVCDIQAGHWGQRTTARPHFSLK